MDRSRSRLARQTAACQRRGGALVAEARAAAAYADCARDVMAEGADRCTCDCSVGKGAGAAFRRGGKDNAIAATVSRSDRAAAQSRRDRRILGRPLSRCDRETRRSVARFALLWGALGASL